MVYLSLLSGVLSALMLIIYSSILKKTMLSSQKLSPFECGYTPMTEARLPFSLHFFILAIMFLIFDVEIAIILPMPIIQGLVNKNLIKSFTLMFILILILGLLHEWAEGSLSWVN